MNRLTGIRFVEGKRVFQNFHFWIIVSLIICITFIYYSDISSGYLFKQNWKWFWHLKVFEFNNDIQGILFFIPFIYAALVYWWRGILFTWLIAVAIMIPLILYYAPNVNSLVTNMFLLLVPLLIVAIIALQIKWRDSEKKASLEREKERQAYISQIFSSQEEERKRISREVHDDTTQRLWIVANDVQRLATEHAISINPQFEEDLKNIKDTMFSIAEDTKRLSLALRPGILDDLGLVPAIRWLVDQLNRDDSVTAKVTVEGRLRTLNQDTNNHIFRIVQEALNNVRRHAEATEVKVILDFSAETIKLIVQDNGKGFLIKDVDSYPLHDRIGLIGIQERSRLLDSSLIIDSKPGKGTTISVEFSDL